MQGPRLWARNIRLKVPFSSFVAANPRSHRKNPGERFSAATIGQAYLGARVASTVGMNNATHLQVDGVG
jgi:hypothetical protein